MVTIRPAVGRSSMVADRKRRRYKLPRNNAGQTMLLVEPVRATAAGLLACLVMVWDTAGPMPTAGWRAATAGGRRPRGVPSGHPGGGGGGRPLTRKQVVRADRPAWHDHRPGTVAKALADLTAAGELVNSRDKGLRPGVPIGQSRPSGCTDHAGLTSRFGSLLSETVRPDCIPRDQAGACWCQHSCDRAVETVVGRVGRVLARNRVNHPRAATINGLTEESANTLPTLPSAEAGVMWLIRLSFGSRPERSTGQPG